MYVQNVYTSGLGTHTAALATINVRIDPALKEEVQKTLAKRRQKLSRVVKDLLAQQLLIERLAPPRDAPVPEWVPRGKYVALVKGVVAAVGDSAATVASEAMSKFPQEPVVVKRKGAPIPRIDYAYAALAELHCWRYLVVGETEYPVLPATVIGRKRIAAAAIPDTAASLSLADARLIKRAELRSVGVRQIYTGGGRAPLRVFRGRIELPTGSYSGEVAGIRLPPEFPAQLLLGRNILDAIDVYLLGKRRVACVRDP